MAVIGWTTLPAADAYLAAGINSGAWAEQDQATRERYLTEAHDRLRDHPAYRFPDEPDRRMSEAQALYAAWLLNNPGRASSSASGNGGITSYRLLDYSETRGRTSGGRDPGEGLGMRLPDIVADKLAEWLYNPIISARRVRTPMLRR